MALNKDTENTPQNAPAEIPEQEGLSAEASAKAGYKKTPLGRLPVEWEVVRFEEIMSNGPQNGLYKPLDEYSTSGTPIVRIDNFNDGELGDPQSFKRVELSEEEIERYKLFPHDIVINRVNSITHVGKSALIPTLEGDTVFESNMMRISLNLSVASPEYIIRILVFPSFLGRLRLKAKTAIAQVSLNQHDIRSAPIPLPPLPEQQQIAAILSTWDKAIERTQALIAAKEERRKGVMQRLLRGKVRVKGFEKEKGYRDTRIGLVPKDWKVLKSSDIFKSVSVKNNDGQPLLAVTQENGVIPRDMLEGRVTMPSGSTDSYKLVVPGNFVISLRSFQGGLEYSEYEGIVSPAYTVLKNKKPIDDTFFKFFFKSQEFISRLSVAVIGIRDGKQISFSDFSAMSFRYPPIEEQRAIGRILTEADREIELLHTKLEALQAQKKGLMQRLLTGRVRVKIVQSKNPG